MSNSTEDGPRQGDRFLRALAFAGDRHLTQTRKDAARTPYLGHLLGVASIVIEDGGDEDESIAALLHDALEDGKATEAEIRERFGDRVLGIATACSDGLGEPRTSVTWRTRKQAYIDHLAGADASALRVSLADKLYTARETLFDLRREGDLVWTRFNKARDDTLWYYDMLLRTFRKRRGEDPIVSELARVLAELWS